MARHIKAGDIVEILTNDSTSELWQLTHYYPHQELELRQFKVISTPAGVGDSWYLEGWAYHIGIDLALNPSSANLDAIVKALDKKDAEDREARLRTPRTDPITGQ
jgi:hypothetical protein